MNKLIISTLLLSLFLQSCSNSSMERNENRGEVERSGEGKYTREVLEGRAVLAIKFQEQMSEIEKLMAQLDTLKESKTSSNKTETQEEEFQKVEDKVKEIRQKTEGLATEFQQGTSELNTLMVKALNVLIVRLNKLEKSKASNNENQRVDGEKKKRVANKKSKSSNNDKEKDNRNMRKSAENPIESKSAATQQVNSRKLDNITTIFSQDKSIIQEGINLNDSTYQTIVKKISQIKSPTKVGRDKVKFSLNGVSEKNIENFFKELSIKPEYITKTPSKVWIGLRPADYEILQSKIKEPTSNLVL